MLLESFKIPGDAEYRITNSDDAVCDTEAAPFYAWRAGLLIGKGDTHEAVRNLLHLYACNQLRNQLASWRRQIADAEKSLSTLGTDVFNLRVFRAIGPLDEILKAEEL